jgi:ferrous iron transport protein A
MKQRAGVYDLFEDKDYQEVDAVMRPGMPLAVAGTGEKVRILMFASGRGMRQRLISMGLDIGSEIEVIRRGVPGPFLIAIGDTRLAIGAEMAHKIMVISVERKIE